MGFVADAFESAVDLIGDLEEGFVKLVYNVSTLQFEKAWDDLKETTNKVIKDILEILVVPLKLIFDDETAYKIAGIVMIVAVAVVAWYLAPVVVGLSETIGAIVASQIAAAVATGTGIAIAGQTAIIVGYYATTTIATVALSTGISMAASMAGEAITQQVPSLGFASSLLPVVSMLGFGYNGGFGAISNATSETLNLIGLGGGAGYLAPVQSAYGIFQSVEAYQGYLQLKAGLEESYNSIYEKFRMYNDGLKNEGFAEIMQFATGKYYQNFAGQPMYNIYQPSRELYIPMDVATPFDGSTKPRIDLAQYQFDVDALYVPKQDFISRTLGLDLVRTS